MVNGHDNFCSDKARQFLYLQCNMLFLDHGMFRSADKF